MSAGRDRRFRTTRGAVRQNALASRARPPRPKPVDGAEAEPPPSAGTSCAGALDSASGLLSPACARSPGETGFAGGRWAGATRSPPAATGPVRTSAGRSPADCPGACFGAAGAGLSLRAAGCGSPLGAGAGGVAGCAAGGAAAVASLAPPDVTACTAPVVFSTTAGAVGVLSSTADVTCRVSSVVVSWTAVATGCATGAALPTAVVTWPVTPETVPTVCSTVDVTEATGSSGRAAWALGDRTNAATVTDSVVIRSRRSERVSTGRSVPPFVASVTARTGFAHLRTQKRCETGLRNTRKVVRSSSREGWISARPRTPRPAAWAPAPRGRVSSTARLRGFARRAGRPRRSSGRRRRYSPS